jgi:hypothetical protein
MQNGGMTVINGWLPWIFRIRDSDQNISERHFAAFFIIFNTLILIGYAGQDHGHRLWYKTGWYCRY